MAAGAGVVILDTAHSHQRDVARHEGGDEAVLRLLDRLRDPQFGSLLLVTLPESPPVLRGLVAHPAESLR